MTEPAAQTGIGRASAVLASGTVVSRVLGFVNAAVLAWALGQQNQGANAFALANQLPNNIYAIISGGLLSAVLVPQIVRAARHDDGGQKFVNRLITLGIVAFLAVAVLATVCAPLLVPLYAREGRAFSSEGLDLAIAFAFWCLPQIFFYALYSLLGEVLNARGIFGPFTWAPVINNIVAIAALLVFAGAYGVDPAHRDPASWGSGQIALLAGGATLGVIIQCVTLIAFWRRTGLTFRPDFHWRGVGLGDAGRAAGWTFGMVMVTQIAGIIQSNIATLAGENDPSVAVLRTAWLIFVLPHSVVTISIAIPYFTRMSGHAHDGDVSRVRGDLSAFLRTVGLLITGSTVALAAAAIPFAAFFANTPQEVVGISTVLLAYLIGLVPFSALFLVQRTFYALGDSRTPFFIQVLQASLFVIGAFACILLPPQFIAVGLAAVTSFACIIQALVAAWILRRRMGGIDGWRVLRRMIQYGLAAIPAGAVGVAVLALLGGFSRGYALSGPIPELIAIGAVAGATGVVYFAVLTLARIPELRELSAPLGRFTRRG